jgi:hypothetical protein
MASAVGVFAIFDGVDAEGVGVFFGKADAVIADAEALLSCLALEFFHAARTVFGQAVDRQKDVHGDVLRDGADVGLGFFGNDDPLQAAGSLAALRI